MEKEKAFSILVEALNVATKAGVFNLADTAQINNALITLNPTNIQNEEL